MQFLCIAKWTLSCHCRHCHGCCSQLARSETRNESLYPQKN